MAAAFAIVIAVLALPWFEALVQRFAAGLARPAWRCLRSGRSAVRPATCSAAPSRSRRTAILVLLASRLA